MKKKVKSLNGLLILTLSSVLQNETNIMKLIKILKNWLSDSNLLGSFQNWSSHCFLSMLISRQAYYKYLQKQPSRGVLRKRYLKICSKFKGEHPCRNVISIKLLCNFIEITFRYGCSPLNLLHIFRTLFPENTSRGLLLQLIKYFSQ